MNINYKHIDEIGGFVATEIELNTPNLPEFDEKEITFFLFDGFGVAEFEGKYIQLKYPSLGDVRNDTQTRRTINQMRFGNRLEENFKMTIDDLAICFGEVEEISQQSYLRLLVHGLLCNQKKFLKGANITETELTEKLTKICHSPCKHFYIFKDELSFLQALDGKIYAIGHDAMCHDYICDILEEDMIELEDQEIISDGRLLTPDALEFIISQRVEIIILNRKRR